MRAKVVILLLLLASALPITVHSQQIGLPDYLKPKTYFFYNGTAPLSVFSVKSTGMFYFAYNFTIIDVSTETIHFLQEEWIYNGSVLVSHKTYDVIQSLAVGAGPWFILPDHINNNRSIAHLIGSLVHCYLYRTEVNMTFEDGNYTISFYGEEYAPDENVTIEGYIVLNEDGLMLEFYGYQKIEALATQELRPSIIHIKLADTNYQEEEEVEEVTPVRPIPSMEHYIFMSIITAVIVAFIVAVIIIRKRRVGKVVQF